MEEKPSIEDLIAQRLRLIAEGKRIMSRIDALNDQIDASLNPNGQRPPKPEESKAQEQTPPQKHDC